MKERLQRLHLERGFNYPRPINMCLGEVYCVDCKLKEYYNFNDPYSKPNKCKKCGGRLTDKQTEELLME